MEYQRKCPKCGSVIHYRGKYAYHSYWRGNNQNRSCKECANKYWIGKVGPTTGHKWSDESKKLFSLKVTGVKRNELHRKNTSIGTKKALSNPEIRKKLRDCASNQPRRFGKAVDKGQVEMINCWNKLGFSFEVNYKLHTNDFLYFLDGYDKKHNVVLEYDSKYHNTTRNVKKDLIRQNKIINILKPNKFWRYDAVNKQCKNVLEGVM
jgi:hypothetical protein